MITKEYRQVFKALTNSKSKSFFTFDAACKSIARQHINNHEDCSCGDIAFLADGREVNLQCSYHEFLHTNPDEFKKIYEKEFKKVKSEYRSKP